MKTIAEFLDGYSGTTTAGYRSAIFQFLDSKYGNQRAGKDSTPEERKQYEKLAAEYLGNGVSVLKDLKGFKDALTKNRRPPHSISQNIACVRIWLEENDHSLTSKEIRELKKYMPRQRAGVTREAEVTSDTIRNILNHTSDTRLRAAILIMESSGIRIGELLGLTDDDIDMKTRTIHISDLIAKTGESRITFFTEEAAAALEAYQAERKKFIERAGKLSKRIDRKHNQNSTEVFPFSDKAIRDTFIRALVRSDLHSKDKRTNRSTIHPHVLRKYFSSTLKLSGCPDEVVEELMGHRAGLASSYRRFGPAQLREKYREYEHVLVIGDFGFDARRDLKAKVLDLETRNAELTKRLSEVEGRVKLGSADETFAIELPKKLDPTVRDAFLKLLQKIGGTGTIRY